MSKPTIFLSSTCYDPSATRTELEVFLGGYDFQVLNSESNKFGVTPQKHSHSACLDQIRNADFLLLIIGGRRGGTFIGSERSITNEEYQAAVKLGIPRIICVKKDVFRLIPVFKKNPNADFKPTVDDPRVFNFIDYIQASSEDNWIFQFDTIDDIKQTLRSRFAYYLRLFSQNLRASSQKEIAADSTKLTFVKFPNNIERIAQIYKLAQEEETGLRNGLRKLHSIISTILSSNARNDGKIEKLKCLWVIAHYGELKFGQSFKIDSDVFKDFAWSVSRGRRVFEQMKGFGINGRYEPDEDGRVQVELSFPGEDEDTAVANALETYSSELIKQFGEEEGFELFKKADMRLYMDTKG